MKLRAGPVGALLGLSVGACFIKPDAPAADDAAVDPRDARGPDAIGSDAGVDAPTLCARYEFTGGSASCGGWGSGSGTFDVGNGVLTITAPGTGTTTSTCTRGTSEFSSVTFEIASLPQAFQTTTELFVRTGGVRYGVRFYNTGGPTPYCGASEGAEILLPSGTMLVRIRKTTSGTNIDLAAGGANWTTTNVNCPGLGSAEIAVEVKRSGAGMDSTLGLESLEICP